MPNVLPSPPSEEAMYLFLLLGDQDAPKTSTIFGILVPFLLVEFLIKKNKIYFSMCSISKLILRASLSLKKKEIQ